MKRLIAGMAILLSICTSALAQDYANHTINIGQKAPDLQFPGPDGKTQKLSEINKGRIVLLDFWASWCGPCRRASPEVVALYNKYKDEKFTNAKKGFTVVSVSLDQNKEAWLAAIDQDKLAWPYHMSDLGSWKSKGALIYGVEFIPQSFLLGPDGKVIAKYSLGANPESDIDKLLKKKS